MTRLKTSIHRISSVQQAITNVSDFRLTWKSPLWGKSRTVICWRHFSVGTWSVWIVSGAPRWPSLTWWGRRSCSWVMSKTHFWSTWFRSQIVKCWIRFWLSCSHMKRPSTSGFRSKATWTSSPNIFPRWTSTSTCATSSTLKHTTVKCASLASKPDLLKLARKFYC